MRLVTALTLVLVVAACGGDEPEPAEQQTPPAQQQPRPQPQPQAEAESAPEPQPEPEPEPEPEPQPATQQALYTVQVAAFIDASMATEWAGRLRSQGMPVWTSTAQVDGRTFHRLRFGALPSVGDTRRLARLVRAKYGWPVWVAPLTPADRLPVDAVRSTRSVMQEMQADMPGGMGAGGTR